MFVQIMGYWLGFMFVWLLIAEVVFGIGCLIAKAFRKWRGDGA